MIFIWLIFNDILLFGLQLNLITVQILRIHWVNLIRWWKLKLYWNYRYSSLISTLGYIRSQFMSTLGNQNRQFRTNLSAYFKQIHHDCDIKTINYSLSIVISDENRDFWRKKIVWEFQKHLKTAFSRDLAEYFVSELCFYWS
jgi:hypothetical protein